MPDKILKSGKKLVRLDATLWSMLLEDIQLFSGAIFDKELFVIVVLKTIEFVLFVNEHREWTSE